MFYFINLTEKLRIPCQKPKSTDRETNNIVQRQHKKLKTEQHEPYKNQWLFSGALKVEQVMLLTCT